MRTGLSACKVQHDIAELTIGHVKTGIVAVHDQYVLDEECAEAMNRCERYLRGILEGSGADAGPSNVIDLRKINKRG